MLVLIRAKDTENIIGLKEDIAMRLADAADIEHIDIIQSGGSYHVEDDTITADIIVHEAVRRNHAAGGLA